MKQEQQLLDSYLDGELTPDEQARLAEWLAADAAHVRQFVRETSLHRQIRESMLARPYHAYGRSEVENAQPKARSASVSVSASRNQTVVAADVRRRISGRLSASSPRRLQFERAAKPFLLALAASIVLVAGVWWFSPTQGAPALAEIQGTGLTLERGSQTLPAVAGTRLQSGDVLRTPENVTATINFAPEKTRITINPSTELKLVSMSRGKRFALVAGKLEASVARQRLFQPMVLITPQAEARVLGTKFTLTATTNATRLEVTEGKVKLTRISDDTAVKVGAGQYAIAANGVELAALPRTGQIFREIWTHIPGDSWRHLITHENYPDRPDGRGYLTNLASFEMPSNWADNYGLRLRGYIHPPKTGDYTFWLAAKDDASLWLTPDEDPANKLQMAHSAGAAAQDWQNNPAQQSATVPLTAGRRYYFEVLFKAGVGDDHLAVAWQRPGGTRELIPGEFLSPFKTDAKEKKR
jgi:hypothetical protein